jgi:hypothetical protein
MLQPIQSGLLSGSADALFGVLGDLFSVLLGMEHRGRLVIQKNGRNLRVFNPVMTLSVGPFPAEFWPGK